MKVTAEVQTIPPNEAKGLYRTFTAEEEILEPGYYYSDLQIIVDIYFIWGLVVSRNIITYILYKAWHMSNNNNS